MNRYEGVTEASPRGDWMQTFTGGAFYPADPQPEEIHIEDIAHALAMQCRYAGHCNEHYCVVPETKILTHDYRWVPAGELSSGDLLWGFDEHSPGGTRKLRKWRPSIATVHGRPIREIIEVTLQDGTVLRCSKEHPLLCAIKAAGNLLWVTAETILARMAAGQAVYLPKLLPVWDEDTSWASGWLAGMFDGEGSLSSLSSRAASLAVAQNPGPLLDKLHHELSTRGFKATQRRGTNHCKTIAVLGGIGEQLRLLGGVRPQRLIAKMQDRMPGRDLLRAGELVRVAAAKHVGSGEVVALETSTHTYITEGYGSHNSVAEHSYLVSKMVPECDALAGLLHDATEAYLVDVPRPVKALLPGYRALEETVWYAICRRFNLSPVLPASVHEADNRILTSEREINMQTPPMDWGIKDDGSRVHVFLLSAKAAERVFLQRFRELTEKR